MKLAFSAPLMWLLANLGSDCGLREEVHNELAETFKLDTNQRFFHVVCNIIFAQLDSIQFGFHSC
jgi:hypothetical protein